MKINKKINTKNSASNSNISSLSAGPETSTISLGGLGLGAAVGVGAGCEGSISWSRVFVSFSGEKEKLIQSKLLPALVLKFLIFKVRG